MSDRSPIKSTDEMRLFFNRPPDRRGGTPVFTGTRVPVQTLIEYLKAGDPLDTFLAAFPAVSREHAVAVLELAKTALTKTAAA